MGAAQGMRGSISTFLDGVREAARAQGRKPRFDSPYGLTFTVAAVGPDDGDEMFPDVAVMIVV